MRRTGGSIVIFIGLFSQACSLCSNTVIQKVISPDRRYKAVVYERDCGATTGFSTHVSVLAIDGVLGNKSGNALIADGDHGRIPLSTTNTIPLSIKWTSPDRLTIAYPKGVRIFARNSKLASVEIAYEEK